MTAGLPGGHAAAAGVELHLQPRRAAPVPAHDLQGRAAGGARARGAWPGCRARPRVAARAAVAVRARSVLPLRRVLAARPRAGRSTTQLLWERVPPAWSDGGRPRRRARRATAARSCCPASSTPTTTGAGRSTRSCRRSPTARWRSATPSATPTCARSTCCGRVDALVQQRRALPGPARPAARPARRPHGGRRRRRRPPRSGAAPAAEAADVLDQLGAARRGLGAGARASRARPGRSARRARCRRCAPGTARRAPGSCASSPTRAATRGRRLAPRALAGARRVRRAARAARLAYAGDLDAPTQIAPRRGEVVITDSNRRRVLVAVAAGAERTAPTLAADEEPSRPTPRCSTCSRRAAADAQTVAVYDGVAARARAVLARRSRSSPSGGRSRRSTATRRRTGRPTAR